MNLQTNFRVMHYILSTLTTSLNTHLMQDNYVPFHTGAILEMYKRMEDNSCFIQLEAALFELNLTP